MSLKKLKKRKKTKTKFLFKENKMEFLRWFLPGFTLIVLVSLLIGTLIAAWHCSWWLGLGATALAILLFSTMAVLEG